jgi:hypothetical protein
MAGKVQHEIPQLYHRGFLIPDIGDAERIFVYRRGGKVYPSNIDRSAAESYFYSPLSTDGTETLDDRITYYEDHIQGLVTALRTIPIGDAPDPGAVAEVIAHLTTRNAHLRGAFAHGFRKIAAHVANAFANEDYIRSLSGFDTPMIPPDFRAKYLDGILNQASAAGVTLPIPVSLLEKIAFAHVREGYSPMLNQQMPLITSMLGMFATQAERQAQEGHNKALEKTFAPERRVQDLSSLGWQVVGTDFDLILPDCVALGVEGEDTIHPLMLADFDRVTSVMLSLTSRSLLIGTKSRATALEPSEFNWAAARCSHTYFLAASRTPDLEALVPLIGSRSVSVVDAAVGEHMDTFDVRQRSKDGQSPHLSEATSKAPSISVTYKGDFDQPLMDRISEALSALAGALTWTIPLDRLDGITFADDYPAALREFDRGKLGIAPLPTRQEGDTFGIAQTPSVMWDDNILKFHIVANGGIARLLVGDNEDHRAWAIGVLADQFAQAGVTQIVDEALPGVLLNHRCKDLEADLHRCTYPCWNSYFAARASAGFHPLQLANAQANLLAILKQAFVEITEARRRLAIDHDMAALKAVALPKVMYALEYAGDVLGYADGVERDPLEGADELRAEIEARQLLAWLPELRRDLVWLWERRGAWASYDEFLALNWHAERLLWTFGVIPFTTDAGEYLIFVAPPPSGADSALSERLDP